MENMYSGRPPFLPHRFQTPMEKNMYYLSGATGSASFPSPPLQTPMEKITYSSSSASTTPSAPFPSSPRSQTPLHMCYSGCDLNGTFYDTDEMLQMFSSATQSDPSPSEPLQTESRPYIGANYDQGDINLCNPTSSNPSALGANYDLSVQSNPLPPPPFRIGRPQPPSLPIPPTENTTFPSAPQATGGPIDMGPGSLCRAASQEAKDHQAKFQELKQTMWKLGLLHDPLVPIERDLATRDPGDLAVPRTHFTDSPVRETRGGEWAEKKDGFKAFRDGEPWQYVLAERTFQFKKTDPQNGGTNAVSRNKRNRTKEIDWEMKEYCLILPHRNPGELFLEENFAVRVISSTGKNAEAESSSSSILHENAEGSSNEAKLAGKRPRAAGPSDIWNHCIKIHTKDKDVVYALCTVCDKALRCGKHNTSTARRHPCLLKHSQPSTITTTTEEAFLIGVKNVHISCA